MRDKTYVALQTLLWSICAFHVMVGLGLNLFPSFPEAMAGYYGATVDWTPQFVYILKPLGVFMLVMGFLAAVAARDPLHNAPIVYAFVAVFVLRAAQRLVFMGVLVEEFQISAGRNFANMVFFFLLGAVLFFLFNVCRRQTRLTGGSPVAAA